MVLFVLSGNRPSGPVQGLPSKTGGRTRGRFGRICPWYPVRKGGPRAFWPLFVHGRFLPRREESLPRCSPQPARSSESHHWEVYTQTCLTRYSMALCLVHFPGCSSGLPENPVLEGCTLMHIFPKQMNGFRQMSTVCVYGRKVHTVRQNGFPLYALKHLEC